MWKQRNLSLKGKITIINTLALALLIYLSSTIDTPDKAIAQVKNIIQHFLWDRKTSKIAQSTLIQTIEHGDHFETKTKALKLLWIKRLIHLAEASWKVLPEFFYKCKILTSFSLSTTSFLVNRISRFSTRTFTYSLWLILNNSP